MYTSEKTHELHSVRDVASFTKSVDFTFLIAVGNLGWTMINFWLAVKQIKQSEKNTFYVYLFSPTKMKENFSLGP